MFRQMKVEAVIDLDGLAGEKTWPREGVDAKYDVRGTKMMEWPGGRQEKTRPTQGQ